MLSLIICSKFPALEKDLLQNIEDTIGIPFEIVNIDNSQGKYNIFEAYNLGVERAKGEYLCFMHEDIVFHSKNWGKVVENYLSQDFVGALGVAGGNIVLDQLDWRFYGFHKVYLIQGIYTEEESPCYSIAYYPPMAKNEPICQVAAIDGVWMCFRKDIFKEIRFDDQNFHDFHLYDSDISMQVNKTGRGIFLTQDVLLEHKSYGTFTSSYKDSLAIFFKKWEKDLPMMKGAIIAKEDINAALVSAQKAFVERLEQDAKLVELRKVIRAKKTGEKCRDYTPEEMELMDKSSYDFRLRIIKDKNIPRAVVKEKIKEYANAPYARKTRKLIMKYFWYRYIKR